MSPITPFLLERKPVPKVWGGRAMEDVLGVELPPGTPIGETWLVYDRPEGSSVIAGARRTLADLLRQDAAALLGADVAMGYGGRFPLLLKFIDAREALSLQVHPDDAQAQRDGDGGKHETCIVLHSGPNARMVKGLMPGVTRDQLQAGADSAQIEQLVRSFTPAVGDCIDVPPGTVHAIGPDVLLFEVEQNSEVTYRLYDWGRTRDVQISKAMAVARAESVETPAIEPQPLPDGGELLVHNDWFRVRRYSLAEAIKLETGGRFLTLTVIGGRGTISWRSSATDQPLRVRAGDTVLVPACVSDVFVSPLGGLELIACDPGAPA